MKDCTPSFPSRLHTFLVVLTACALTVAVVGLAATIALTSYRATLVSAGQNARFISSLVANQMGMALIDIDGTLDEMSLHVKVRGKEHQAEDIRRMNELFDSIRLGELALKGLQLTDEAGHVEAESGMSVLRKAVDIVDIRKRLKGRDMFLSSPVRDPSRPRGWIFSISKRVRELHGESDHYVTAVVDLEALHGSFAKLEMPSGTRIVVSNSDGVVYLAGPGQEEVVGRTVPEFRAQAGNGTRRDIPRLESGTVTGISGVAHFPLQVFAALPRDEVLNPWRRHALTYGGISLALVLVSVGLSVALVRSQMQLNCRSRALALAASTDTLTGVPNRRSFLEAARREFSRAKRNGGALACAMMDLDHFKKVNDTYGHIVGDMVLSSAARLVSSRLRETDLVCRYGGEEFVLLLPDTDLAGAATLAESLRTSLSGLRLELESACFLVTASFGVAEILPDHATFDDLLVHADQALYMAKTQGRNQVCQAPHRPSAV
ncbi:Diguanylate cyclase, GGDEF domain [anaerobic digester metagenome]